MKRENFSKAVTILLAATALVCATGCPATTDSGTTDTSTSDTTSSASWSGTSGTKSVAISNAGKSVSYGYAYLVNGTTLTVSGETLASATSNQVAILVANGGTLTLTGCTITKSGDGSSSSSGTSADDDFNFYGLNSAIVCVGSGSSVILDGCTVTTTAKYSNAVFACDSGAVTIKDGIT